jgi:hypothetical protein
MAVIAGAVGAVAPGALAAPGGPHLEPVAPFRALDTRVGGPRVGVLAPRRVPLTPPDGAVAVALNLTVVHPDGAAFVAVHPCDQAPGGTSTANVRAGDIVANAVPMAPLGPAGVCVTSISPTDIVVDVTGWWRTGDGPTLAARSPSRVLDTRDGGAPRRAAGVPIPVAVPAGPAVAVTLILTEPAADGWAAMHPCAQVPGGTSTVNARTGQTAANLAVVDATAPVCVTASVAAHLVVDVVATGTTTTATASSPTVAPLAPVAPRRLLDTRTGGPAWVAPAGLVAVDFGAATTGVVLNVTAVDPLGPGFVTVWPCSEPRPWASSLSWNRATTVATAVVSGAPDGKVCLAPSVGTHLIVDLLGANGPADPVGAVVTGRTDTLEIGRSVLGRPITARAVGTWGGPVALAVGGIHGDETAGVPLVGLLRTNPPAGVLTWLIEVANPDGYAAGQRYNVRGVDLNRNFPVAWQPGRAGDPTRGPAPLSEPESAALARFVELVRPTVGVWWHQVGDWVDVAASGVARPDLLARYAQAAGVELAEVPCDDGPCSGNATQFANAVIPGSTQFVVELPAEVDAATLNRHAAAFRAVAAG